MNNKLRAAVIGGLVMGVLSAVTLVPQVPFVRFLCCIWAILGGVVAAYLYIKKSPVPARIGDGVVLGLLSGVIGAAISLIAFLLVSFYVSDRTLAEDQLSRHGLHISYASVIWMIGVLTVTLQIIQSLVGGILGVALFEQRRGEGGSGPAPPPPYYGGTPAPTYAPPPPPPAGYGSDTQ
jgi:uncharacterized protein YqgC (DUF456 family)